MNISKTTSSASNVIANSKKRIDNLFSRFAVFYGNLWRSQFKSEGFLEFSKNEWLEGLRPFNDDTLNQAILACRDFQKMPPSLPQMIGFCRDIKKRSSFYVADTEHQPASQKVVEAHLKQCKAFLI